MLVWCAALTAVGCAALPMLIGGDLVSPFAILWGALSYGVYTVAIIELGSRFARSMLVAGNAAFALMWGIGGIAGPPVTGGIMDRLGVEGLPAVLGAFCLVLATVAAFVRWRAPGTASPVAN